MNSYPGINSSIEKLVKKYANSLYCQFKERIDIEDFQQDLMFAAIQALEKFDPRLGLITDFLNKCLHTKTAEISRNIKRQKKKTFLYFCELGTDQLQTSDKSISSAAEINNLIDSLPQGLREGFKHQTKNTKLNYSDYKIIKKILLEIIKSKGVRSQMKNISCIEALSVQELSRLSETDLYDLHIKISDTHSWIKQLVEKFEMALHAKYAADAKKNLYETGLDFGICKLKRNGFVINVNIPKKVQWDQEKLEMIYNTMSPELRKNIFKLSFSIDEKQYSKLDKKMTDAISPARSTTYGKVKISMNKQEETK